MREQTLEERQAVLRSQARPRVRNATVCPVKDCTWRSFDEGFRCPEHGGGVRQENRPYLGVSTR